MAYIGNPCLKERRWGRKGGREVRRKKGKEINMVYVCPANMSNLSLLASTSKERERGKPGMMAYAYFSSIWEVETEGPGI